MTPIMPPIVTLTMNPALDENSSVEYVFSDAKLRCQAPRQEPGGGGINVARAVARLGGEALAIYAAGGPSGDLLGKLLEQEGVPRLVIPIAEWTRRNVNVRENATGRQYRFVFPGPTLSENEWRRCLDTLKRVRPHPEFVVASGSLPPGVPVDFYARVAGIARELKARFVLDASGKPLRLAVEEGVFLVKPSLDEFQQLTEGGARAESSLAEAARHLIAKGHCEAVVLSLGGGGALWVTAAQEERLVAPTVPVASSVGAGDAMVAGIVLSLVREKSLPEAVRFGVAAGAASVMNPGTELCRREDAERLFEQMRPIAV
jgi:6-phosphofructokinase 2